MKLKALSLLATACAVAGGVFAPGAQAATIGGFGARPAHFNPNVPATRAYFIRTVPRGGSFTDQVIVTNTAAKPVTLRVYPVDGLTGATSGVVYGNRGVALHGAGLWVTPDVSDRDRSRQLADQRRLHPQGADHRGHRAASRRTGARGCQRG